MYAIIFHAHQKLDRVARRHLDELLPASFPFPGAKQILRFEAGHGPDGAKLKRQQGAQPWHFVDPHDDEDTQIHDHITHHFTGLKKALLDEDEVRAAFEAAWLAHALVDGLTPAHHYPYEKELESLRGEDRDTRMGIIGRAYVKSDSIAESLQRSLRLVGPKGLLTTHAMFEAGAYAIIAPLRLKQSVPTKQEIERVTKEGVVPVFQDLAREVAGFRIYERFITRGWTQSVCRDVRRELAPRMVKMVTLSWYAAAYEKAKIQT
jgi:hypothetical protein